MIPELNTKQFTVFVIKSNKHATVHSTLCKHVGKLSPRGEWIIPEKRWGDSKGDWWYELFDQYDDAVAYTESLKIEDFPLKTCNDCRVFCGLP